MLTRHPPPPRSLSQWIILAACLFLGFNLSAGTPSNSADNNQRKAIMMGFGDPRKNPDGSATHPQRAKMTFLNLVGNLENDPKKGWTCEFEYDLKVKFGMDPDHTPAEKLFEYIGKHHLGYRIAMNCGPYGQTAPYWRAAVDNGIMPFAPQGNNMTGTRFDDPVGIRCAVSVAGGRAENITSYGQSLEFIDAVPAGHTKYEDTAQSWANQSVAAKFARVLDAHPEFNIWDAREYLRQSASFWNSGWTETNGYGRVNLANAVGKLLPGPPVDFNVVKSHDSHRVTFNWHNFLQTDFAATIIACGNRIIYEGTGSNFVWNADADGGQTFCYWSKNRAGEISRIESYQRRTLSALHHGDYQTCVAFSAPGGGDALPRTVVDRFGQIATNWVCDLMLRPGDWPYYDKMKEIPDGPVAGVSSDLSAMTSLAISKHYRILIAPFTPAETNYYRYKADWDRATAAGMLVVIPHNASISRSRKPEARRLSPPRLFSAITVGQGVTTNRMSFGPGLEFYDSPSLKRTLDLGFTNETDAAGVVAAKLAQILDANPQYNIWDARQHLRQSSSHYGAGWVEDGGYGRPPATPAKIAVLDPAPPLDIQAIKSPNGGAVTFQWQNFLQSSFAKTVITRGDGKTIYEGTGTNFVWPSDVTGNETFHFFSEDKTGRLSRSESYTVLPLTGLAPGAPPMASPPVE